MRFALKSGMWTSGKGMDYVVIKTHWVIFLSEGLTSLPPICKSIRNSDCCLWAMIAEADQCAPYSQLTESCLAFFCCIKTCPGAMLMWRKWGSMLLLDQQSTPKLKPNFPLKKVIWLANGLTSQTREKKLWCWASLASWRYFFSPYV